MLDSGVWPLGSPKSCVQVAAAPGRWPTRCRLIPVPTSANVGSRMLRQWPVLAIHALTTSWGVAKPVAMFSPAAAQLNPAAVILPAKLAPWLNRPEATIVFVHRCAERSRVRRGCRAGRWRLVRCWLIRQTTAARICDRVAAAAGVLACLHVW